jgi:hypothetical protein
MAFDPTNQFDLEERALDRITALLMAHPKGLRISEIAPRVELAYGYVERLLKASTCVLKRKTHYRKPTRLWIVDWNDLSDSHNERPSKVYVKGTTWRGTRGGRVTLAHTHKLGGRKEWMPEQFKPRLGRPKKPSAAARMADYLKPKPLRSAPLPVAPSRSTSAMEAQWHEERIAALRREQRDMIEMFALHQVNPAIVLDPIRSRRDT